MKYSAASPALGHHPLVLRHLIVGWTGVPLGDERGLPERELRDRKPAPRRDERQHSTGRRAPQVRRPSCFLHDRADVFDLALDRVRQRVSAVAAPPAVVVEDREV